MVKEIPMYNPIAPIWALEILGTTTIKAVAEDKEKNIEAVEAKKVLTFEEGYPDVVVDSEFVKEHNPKKGMFYYATRGNEITGCMSSKEIASSYVRVAKN